MSKRFVHGFISALQTPLMSLQECIKFSGIIKGTLFPTLVSTWRITFFLLSSNNPNKICNKLRSVENKKVLKNCNLDSLPQFS